MGSIKKNPKNIKSLIKKIKKNFKKRFTLKSNFSKKKAINNIKKIVKKNRAMKSKMMKKLKTILKKHNVKHLKKIVKAIKNNKKISKVIKSIKKNAPKKFKLDSKQKDSLVKKKGFYIKVKALLKTGIPNHPKISKKIKKTLKKNNVNNVKKILKLIKKTPKKINIILRKIVVNTKPKRLNLKSKIVKKKWFKKVKAFTSNPKPTNPIILLTIKTILKKHKVKSSKKLIKSLKKNPENIKKFMKKVKKNTSPKILALTSVNNNNANDKSRLELINKVRNLVTKKGKENKPEVVKKIKSLL